MTTTQSDVPLWKRYRKGKRVAVWLPHAIYEDLQRSLDEAAPTMSAYIVRALEWDLYGPEEPVAQ
jgi:tricorn protease-like protein